MSTLLVTGGCGFIGSNFVRHILTTDPDVVVINFDALTYAGNLSNLADLRDHPRHRFFKGDVTDREEVRAAFGLGARHVIHFAAESHVDRSIQDSGPFVRTNVLGTQVLLDAAREFAVERYVQVSTDEVYGSLGPTGAFTETTPLAPSSPYSASKAAADLLVQSYAHTFGMPAHHRAARTTTGRISSRRSSSPCSSPTYCATNRFPFTAMAAKSATGSTSSTTAGRWSESGGPGAWARSTTSAAAPRRRTWN